MAKSCIKTTWLTYTLASLTLSARCHPKKRFLRSKCLLLPCSAAPKRWQRAPQVQRASKISTLSAVRIACQQPKRWLTSHFDRCVRAIKRVPERQQAPCRLTPTTMRQYSIRSMGNSLLSHRELRFIVHLRADLLDLAPWSGLFRTSLSAASASNPRFCHSSLRKDRSVGICMGRRESIGSLADTGHPAARRTEPESTSATSS